jgi:hypothetical protein
MNKLKILSVAVFLIPALWSEAQCMETQIKEEGHIPQNTSALKKEINLDPKPYDYDKYLNPIIIPMGTAAMLCITHTHFTPLQSFAVSASAMLITCSMSYAFKRCISSHNMNDYQFFRGVLYSASMISTFTTIVNVLHPFLSEKDIENMLILDQLKKAGL